MSVFPSQFWIWTSLNSNWEELTCRRSSHTQIQSYSEHRFSCPLLFLKQKKILTVSHPRKKKTSDQFVLDVNISGCSKNTESLIIKMMKCLYLMLWSQIRLPLDHREELTESSRFPSQLYWTATTQLWNVLRWPLTFREKSSGRHKFVTFSYNLLGHRVQKCNSGVTWRIWWKISI